MTMRAGAVFISISILTAHAHGQRSGYVAHNRLMAEAERLTHLHEFDHALAKYDSALALVPWETSEYFEVVSAALHAGQEDLAIDLLLQGADHGFDPTDWTDSLLQNFLSSPAVARYRNERPARHTAYLATVDTTFITDVIHMVDVDQAVRIGGTEPGVMVRQDSIHFERMIAICEEHGYPTWRRLGAKTGYWWLLLWHHRGAIEYPHSDQWQRILPHIERAIEMGDLDPAYLCSFDDHVSEERGEPMQYGALLSYFQYVPERIHLVDQETLDRNRASVGWGPISWEAEAEGIDLSKVRFATR
jgi:hypothetical protein